MWPYPKVWLCGSLCLFTRPDLLSQDELGGSLDPLMPTPVRSSTTTTSSGLASGGIFSVDSPREGSFPEDTADLASLSPLGSSGLMEAPTLAAEGSWGTGIGAFGVGGAPQPELSARGSPSPGFSTGGLTGTSTGCWLCIVVDVAVRRIGCFGCVGCAFVYFVGTVYLQSTISM